MDYNSEEYLALFNKIKNTDKPQQQNEMLKEVPNYDQYQNLNEIQRQPQPQNFNMNEFNIETKVNGQRVNEANPNGLNQFLETENLNEIKRHEKQENLNEVMVIREQERLLAVKQQEHLNELKRQEKQRELEKLNETVNFRDADVVTLDMFNKANYNSMMQVADRVIPKG